MRPVPRRHRHTNPTALRKRCGDAAVTELPVWERCYSVGRSLALRRAIGSGPFLVMVKLRSGAHPQTGSTWMQIFDGGARRAFVIIAGSVSFTVGSFAPAALVAQTADTLATESDNDTTGMRTASAAE